MHPALEGVSVAGLIKPGQVYILVEQSNSGFPAESIDSTYIVRTEREILEALDMQMSIVLADWYELRRFVGIRKICDDCHEFRMICYDMDMKERTIFSFYLHRLRSFSEELKRARELFLDFDDDD
jgi:hypothetical protein